MNEQLLKKIKDLPPKPGVYLMRQGQKVIYVGKAKSLRARWKGYLSGQDTRAFVALLETVLTDIETILTDTEKEALLLENELIKQYQPRFNVKLTDDKRFLSLRLDVAQDYPRLELVRRIGKDRARYFGPYHSAASIRQSLRLINRHFQLRTCSDEVMRSRKRPCLQYQIKRCPAPCVFDVSADYAANTQSVADFLDGKTQDLLTSLEQRMQHKSAQLEFESAALIRDQLQAVERSLENQRVVSTDLIDRDVIGIYRAGPMAEIHVSRVRLGAPVEAFRFSLTDDERPLREVLGDFLARYYVDGIGAQRPPSEVLLPIDPGWRTEIEQVFKERHDRGLTLIIPRRGDKKRQIETAQRNAQHAFEEKQRQSVLVDGSLAELKKRLHLRRLPERIECVDISHHQGEAIVASVVHLERGRPVKSMYRHYRIRTTETQDDFRSIYEVVSRRARRGLEEADLPQLFVIDGGKGQLAAARAALEDHGIDDIDLVGLAKARQVEEENVRSNERVFVVGHKNPVILRQNSAALFLLTHARDEAHRFAITKHRQLKSKRIRRSALEDIPGIGPKRRARLLQHFGSLSALKKAPKEAVVKLIGPSAAKKVLEHLHSNKPVAPSPQQESPFDSQQDPNPESKAKS